MSDETNEPTLNEKEVSIGTFITLPVPVDTTESMATETAVPNVLSQGQEENNLLTEEAKALSDTENTQGSLTIDTSNSELDKLSTETLLEKRKALMWIATTGATKSDSVSFFQGELGPIEMELRKRGIKLN